MLYGSLSSILFRTRSTSFVCEAILPFDSLPTERIISHYVSIRLGVILLSVFPFLPHSFTYNCVWFTSEFYLDPTLFSIFLTLYWLKWEMSLNVWGHYELFRRRGFAGGSTSLRVTLRVGSLTILSDSVSALCLWLKVWSLNFFLQLPHTSPTNMDSSSRTVSQTFSFCKLVIVLVTATEKCLIHLPSQLAK